MNAVNIIDLIEKLYDQNEEEMHLDLASVINEGSSEQSNLHIII